MSMTCPRRIADIGPWGLETGQDTWRADRWGKDRIEVCSSRYQDGEQTILSYKIDWVWDFIPRTCSFCGGLHPEDAIRLLTMGWLIRSTDKHYKRYLSPPHDDPVKKKKQEELEGTTHEGLPIHVTSPMPKLYTHHFTPEQAARFNKLSQIEPGN